jgi:hypothetical protein
MTVGRNNKTPQPKVVGFFVAEAPGAWNVGGAKSCRNSQSDHSVISATAPLFDLQSQVSCPTTHAPRIQELRLTAKGCKGLTQETCKAYHPQTNIEPWLKGVEPRKKKHNYWLVSSNVLIFGTILP